MSYKDKPNKIEENEDRLRALLALVRTETADPGPCPDPNDMAAFMQGTIEPDKRKAIEAHINLCHECHEDCLAFSTVFGRSSPQPSLLTRMKSMLAGLIDRINIRPWHLVPGLATAAVACLVLVMWGGQSQTNLDLPAKPYLNKVSNGYLPQVPYEFTRSLQRYRSFGSERDDLNSKKAFGSGLWSARNDLSDSPEIPPADFQAEKWQETPWAADFGLGRWSYLMSAVIASGKPLDARFWQQQFDIATDIHAAYLKARQNLREGADRVKARRDQIQTLQGLIKEVLDFGPDSKKADTRKTEIETKLDELINYDPDDPLDTPLMSF